jgi:hypothetical protein
MNNEEKKKKDEMEKIYLMGWFFGTLLTMLAAYLCFYTFIIPGIVAHFCAAMVIFRFDDDGGNDKDKKDEDPDEDDSLPLPDDGLSIKRLGDINFDKKPKPKAPNYDFSNN